MTLEDRFWAQVWRCTHRWPCKKCCWPWWPSLRPGLHPGTYKDHPSFRDARLAPTSMMYVHRVAYLLTHGTLLLPGIIICHQCHFSPCCNPAHLCAGTQGDNVRDMRGKGHNGEGYPLVRLPSGYLIELLTVDTIVSLDYLGGRKEQDTETKPATLTLVGTE